MMLKVRVVSFNVLSSHLATTSHYPALNPDHLDANNRLQVVLEKLQNELTNNAYDGNAAAAAAATNTGTTTASSTSGGSSESAMTVQLPTIFALQEISYDWTGALHTFFANHGYHFVTGLYGQKFNGYMGIGIAYPQSSFTCIETKIARLSDTRVGGWPRAPFKPEGTTITATTTFVSRTIRQLQKHVVLWSTRLLSSLPLLLTASASTTTTTTTTTPFINNVCAFEKAEYRYNVILGIQLQHKGSGITFCIGNYHMPCLYYMPPVMTIHADMAVRFIQDMATITTTTETDTEIESVTESTTTTTSTSKRIPYVLAGDFNFKPIDGIYKYVTTGKFDENKEHFEPFDPSVVQSRLDPNFKWTSTMVEPVKSSYASLSVAAAEANNADNNNNNITTEPDFTNYSITKDQDEPFIETLDYIFVSPNNITVSSVLQLPNRNDANGPFPNLDVQEPSDHLMIAANLDITN